MCIYLWKYDHKYFDFWSIWASVCRDWAAGATVSKQNLDMEFAGWQRQLHRAGHYVTPQLHPSVTVIDALLGTDTKDTPPACSAPGLGDGVLMLWLQILCPWVGVTTQNAVGEKVYWILGCNLQKESRNLEAVSLLILTGSFVFILCCKAGQHRSSIQGGHSKPVLEIFSRKFHSFPLLCLNPLKYWILYCLCLESGCIPTIFETLYNRIIFKRHSNRTERKWQKPGWSRNSSEVWSTTQQDKADCFSFWLPMRSNWWITGITDSVDGVDIVDSVDSIAVTGPLLINQRARERPICGQTISCRHTKHRTYLDTGYWRLPCLAWGRFSFRGLYMLMLLYILSATIHHLAWWIVHYQLFFYHLSLLPYHLHRLFLD